MARYLSPRSLGKRPSEEFLHSSKASQFSTFATVLVVVLCFVLQTRDYLSPSNTHTHKLVTLDNQNRPKLFLSVNITMKTLRCEQTAISVADKFGRKTTSLDSNVLHARFVHVDEDGQTTNVIERESHEVSGVVDPDPGKDTLMRHERRSDRRTRMNDWVPVTNKYQRPRHSRHLEVWDVDKVAELVEYLEWSSYTLVFFGASESSEFCPLCLNLEPIFEDLAREVQSKLTVEDYDEKSDQGREVQSNMTVEGSVRHKKFEFAGNHWEEEDGENPGLVLVYADCATNDGSLGEICTGSTDNSLPAVTELPRFQLFVKNSPAGVFHGERTVENLLQFIEDEIRKSLTSGGGRGAGGGGGVLHQLARHYHKRRHRFAEDEHESDDAISVSDKSNGPINADPRFVGCEVSLVMEISKTAGHVQFYPSNHNSELIYQNIKLSHVVNGVTFSDKPPIENVDDKNDRKMAERLQRWKRKQRSTLSSITSWTGERNSIPEEIEYGNTAQHCFTAHPVVKKGEHSYVLSSSSQSTEQVASYDDFSVMVSYDVNPYVVFEVEVQKLAFYEFLSRLIGLFGGVVASFRLLVAVRDLFKKL